MKRFALLLLMLAVVISYLGIRNVHAQEMADAPLEATTSVIINKGIGHSETHDPRKDTEKKGSTSLVPPEQEVTEKIVYAIQAGSHKNKEYADTTANRLKKMGFKCYVQSYLDNKGGTWYRLKVGDFETREEAEKIQGELRQKAPEFKTYIVQGNAERLDQKGTEKIVYVIQGGSHKKKEYADSTANRLKEMGFISYVQSVLDNKGGTWYRLKVGDFETREEAEKIQGELREKAPEFKTYIVRENAEQLDQKVTEKIVYVIQAGSHKNKEYADTTANRLKKMGFKCYVQSYLDNKGGTWYRLKVGDFETREEAEKIQGELREKAPEFKTYIVQGNAERLDQKVTEKIGYAIQAGSHKNKEYADTTANRLKKMGFKCYVQSYLDNKGGTWYRLKVGDFETREEAEKIQGELREKAPEFKSYIVQEEVESEETVILTPSVSADVEVTASESEAAETPSESKAAEIPPESKAAETPPESKAAETPPESKAAETPSESKAAETPPESKAAETPSESKAAETPPESEAAETPSESEAAETIETPTPEAKEISRTKQKIALDFEDADIKEVINALAEILDINYIIDPKVRGKVNIHTSGEIPVEGLLPILETIFEVNNVAAVKVGNIYKIIPVKDAEKQYILPQVGKEIEDPSSPDRVILQIVPLRYIASKEMTKILKRFLGKGGDIVDYPDRNILIILDTAGNMQKLLTLIDAVDLSIFDTMYVRFYDLEESEAKDLAKELEDLFKALGVESKKKKGGGEMVNFIPIERLNIILAVTSMPEMFDKVTEWIEKLDTVRDDLEEQIFVYFVENAKAVEIGDIIKELYGEKKSTKQKTPTRIIRTRDKKTKTTTKRRTTTGLGTTTGEIKVVIDETNNAILVRATPQDYAQVLKTIKLLDIIPKQVLIEVLIAEVKLDKNFEFGVEWTFADDYASLGGYKGIDRLGQNFNLGGLGADLTQPLTQAGFTYGFASDALEAFLKAYARDNEVNILSTPHILVADNTEAKIDIGEEVPIVTSEYTPTTIETNTSLSRSIEYRDTGILLTVTPRINDKGLVSMEVNQEVSNVSEQRIEGIDSPIILKRQAETTLVVQDGRTIVIGGLISETKDMTKEGIPFLYKIPYLGSLFGFEREVSRKIELLFLITPHVVKTLEEAELVTQEFKEKVRRLIDMIEK